MLHLQMLVVQVWGKGVEWGREGVIQCVCVCVCVFFLLSLFVTLCQYIFLHLTVMYSSTFGKGWVGRSCLYFLV